MAAQTALKKYRTRSKNEQREHEHFLTLQGDVSRVRSSTEDGEADQAESVYRFEVIASTDKEIEIWGGVTEVLGHEEGEVRLDWLASGNAPLLWNHDRSQQIGIIEAARIEGGKIIATVRFSPSAEKIARDVEAGTIKNASIGYRIYAEKIDSRQVDADGNVISTRWKITDWQPMELSFVSVPADQGAGIGRSEGQRRAEFLNEKQAKRQDSHPITTTGKNMNVEDNEAVRKAERERAANIGKLADNLKERGLGDFTAAAREAIERGDSVSDFQAAMLEKITPQRNISTADLGLSEREAARFSLSNVFDGLSSNNLRDCQFELEVSDATRKAYGGHGDAKRICIPSDVLLRGYMPKNQAFSEAQRALVGVSVGNSTAANLVPRELMAEMFIQSIRENSVLLEGAQILQGLIGDIDVPVELVNANFSWVGEDLPSPESDYQIGTIPLRFKTLTSSIPITRRALKQSLPNIEGVIARNLREGISRALEKTAWNPIGIAGRPTGILATAGIGSVELDAGGVLTFDKILELIESLGDGAALDRAKFFTSPRGVRAFRTTPTNGAGSALAGNWENGSLFVEGRQAESSSLIPQNVIAIGDPSSLLVGLWGGVEIAIDDSTKATTGGKVIRIFQDADFAVTQAQRWAAITNLA